jgi:glyoxylate reductase
MTRILVTRRLPDGGLDPLLDPSLGHEVVGPNTDDRAMTSSELVAHAGEVDAIVCLLTDRIDAAVLEAGRGRLKVVANAAVGFDNIDLAAARERGIAVCNTPGVLDETTADLALLLMLAAARLSSDAEADLRAGRWRGWGIGQYLGQDVHGAALGLVGYGRIARAVAKRARAFDMNILHHTRRDTHEAGWVANLDDLIAEVDFLSVHVPGGAETHHLIDSRRLGLLRETAVFVNTARGSVVDEEALAIALETGSLFAAGLDVYEREPEIHPRLLSAPRTVLLPHIGSASRATRTKMARMACDSANAILANRSAINRVA